MPDLSPRAKGWVTGWLHAGAGAQAASAVRACGDPAMILVDDADGRADVVSLLESLAGQNAGPTVRVVLVTRSATGLRAALAAQLAERHVRFASAADVLDVEPEGGRDDWIRWFGEAVSAFVAALDRPAPVMPERFLAARAGVMWPFVVLQAQALLAVLGEQDGDRDPRDLSFDEVAEALMSHERRRWQAMATTWEWGDGAPPSTAVQERSIAALALLGADSEAEASEVLRRVPELRDASAERLSAIASWVAALYPDIPGPAPRIRPDMIGDWFIVSQLTAHPELARGLQAGLTDDQAARALGSLARAADQMETASHLFGDFAAGDIRRHVRAAVLAAMTGEVGHFLLDAVIAEQIRLAEEWTLEQLTDLDRLLPEHVLLRTNVAVAELTAALYRAQAADNTAAHQADLAAALNSLGNRLDQVGRYQEALETTHEAISLRRALAADHPAAHHADLAAALNNLGNRLDQVGRSQEGLASRTEAVRIYRDLASRDADRYQAEYRQKLSALRREYD